jgi:large subunit ribosomal protein L5
MSGSVLKENYLKFLRSDIQKELGLSNIFEVPVPIKIVVNSGIGKEYKNSPSVVEEVIQILQVITGQKPVVTKAKYSISNFGMLKKGSPNGVMVTLRKDLMWNFLYKIVNIILPKIKDFKGMSRKSFDNSGNYTFGLKDHTIFPEIDTSTFHKIRGLNVTIVFDSLSKEHTVYFLEKIGFPFKKK